MRPGNVVARALVAQGLKIWFFITADYAFGAALERDTSQTIKALGGTVVGGVKNPAFALGFLVVSGGGAEQRGAGGRDRQRVHRHDQPGQAGA